VDSLSGDGHLAGFVTPLGSNFEGLGMDKCHGSHGRKAWQLQWEPQQKGAHGKKTPWKNVTVPMEGP